MIKIVCTGPESTGKTTLAQQLAAHFQTLWVPEFARIYLNKLSKPYQQEDLLKIAEGQIQMEEELNVQANKILFCDTSLLVLKIWSEYKFGSCHPFILKEFQKRKYDLFLLCGIDGSWAPDPLRESPNDREELYEIYKKELERAGFNFMEMAGNQEERLKKAIMQISKLP